MTSSEFARRCGALWGTRFASHLARAIGRDISTVHQWKHGREPVPEYVDAILELLEAAPRASWPARFVKARRRDAKPT